MSKHRVLLRGSALIILIMLLVLNGCSNSKNLNNSSAVISKDQLEKMTPAQVINLYIESIKKGDNKTINLLVVKDYFNYYDEKEFPEFAPQKISNVIIKVDEHQPNNNLEANYILTFDVEETSEPRFYRKGQYYFFTKLFFEDNSWKIDHLATSP